MNKSFRRTALLSVAIIAFAACKKTDDNNNNNVNPVITATLGSDTYTEYSSGEATGFNFFGHTSYVLQTNGKTADGSKYLFAYLLSLSNVRPSAGTYNIGGNVSNYSANQLQFLMQDSSAAGKGTYSSDSATNVNVAVTLPGGKVSVAIPAIRLPGIFTPTVGNTYNDTLTFSGTMAVQ